MQIGRITTQAIRDHFVTLEAQVQTQGSPYGICGEQSGTRPDLSLSTLFFLCCHSINVPSMPIKWRATLQPRQLSTCKVTLSDIHNDLPGLDRLLKHKQRI
jgi:hypothetical protein